MAASGGGSVVGCGCQARSTSTCCWEEARTRHRWGGRAGSITGFVAWNNYVQLCFCWEVNGRMTVLGLAVVVTGVGLLMSATTTCCWEEGRTRHRCGAGWWCWLRGCGGLHVLMYRCVAGRYLGTSAI
jgi:hypothetical protein